MEEDIEIVKTMIKAGKEYFRLYGECFITQEELKSVENVLKELGQIIKKDEEILDWQMEYNHWCQLAIDRKKKLEKKDEESHFIQSKLDEANAKIIKLNKVIDEMAKWLYEDDTWFGFGHLKEINTPEKIKQYFYKKVEENEKLQ